jgi:hypothetical protein
LTLPPSICLASIQVSNSSAVTSSSASVASRSEVPVWTGPNPTDRGKLGRKCHRITNRRDIPLMFCVICVRVLLRFFLPKSATPNLQDGRMQVDF